MGLIRQPFESPDHTSGKSDLPSHVPGVKKGEEWVIHAGREAGRHNEAPHRRARDSTSICPESRNPIDPRMPYIPPA
ncbi:MAG: hypothetical protein KY475_05455 [Planctomycetes bacterium]|nr:hypothetical protein [Planctomycetota bacterium]